MKAELDAAVVRLELSHEEFGIIKSALRELLADMHELDVKLRVGASHERVSQLADAFFEEAMRLNIEE